MTTERLWGPQHRPVMLALMSTIGIASYNNLSVAAALPDVGNDLGSIGLLPWVITVELLTSAVAVLATGPIVDSFGVRRTFRVAAAGFAATSLLVAFAPSMLTLIGARAVQGLFVGTVMTVALTGIGLAIPARLRPRAFALTSAVWGVMGVAGPAIAAVIVATVGWRGIFVVNLPVTALAAAVGWNVLPDRQPQATRVSVDRVGIVLIALVAGSALSLTADRTVVTLIGGSTFVIAGAAYFVWARRVPQPVVRLRHLGGRRYRTVHLTSMAVLAGGVGANSFLPLYVKGVRGAGTAAAAFSVLFLTVGWSTSAFVSSRLQDRWAGEWVSLLGSVMALPAAAAVALVIHIDAPLPVVYCAFVWLGAGVGMITSTGAALLQSRTSATEMGRLNGAHQFLRTLAITLGIAIVGAVTFAVVGRRVGDVESVRSLLGDDDAAMSGEVVKALGDGYSLAVTVTAVIVALSVPAAVRLVRTRHEQLPSVV